MVLPKVDRRLCPCIEAPLDNCYCNEMSSQDVEKAIYYCANNYDSCELYLEYHADFSSNAADSFLVHDGCTEPST